jgi:quercetin dioxygenase-like cupin family protein
VTEILNGPSRSGTAYGNVTKKMMKVGDIAVIPPGVPHGWDLTCR